MRQEIQQIRKATRQIATALGEQERMPQHQIKRIVQVCGPDQAFAWLKEVQSMEKQGGMLSSDGTQRRTPGGAYFRLVRTRLTETGETDKMHIIFRGKKPGQPLPGQQLQHRNRQRRSRNPRTAQGNRAAQGTRTDAPHSRGSRPERQRKPSSRYR